MLSKPMQDALNEQIKAETYSAHLYLAMSAWFEAQNLPGFGRWMRAQYIEELTHALKFFDYIIDRGGEVGLKAIDQPPTTFASAIDCFEKALAHEQHVTSLINSLYSLALKDNDYATQSFLKWFIDEQVEEEKTAAEILSQLKAIGSHQASLVMFDGHKGERKATLSV